MLLGLATVTRADITGSIQGVVRDRSQGVVVGAQITIVNVEAKLKYQATSGVDGSYRILALPPIAKMVSVTNLFEISKIQQDEPEGALARRPVYNNVTLG
jgi:hypothetical protein